MFIVLITTIVCGRIGSLINASNLSHFVHHFILFPVCLDGCSKGWRHTVVPKHGPTSAPSFRIFPNATDPFDHWQQRYLLISEALLAQVEQTLGKLAAVRAQTSYAFSRTSRHRGPDHRPEPLTVSFVNLRAIAKVENCHPVSLVGETADSYAKPPRAPKRSPVGLRRSPPRNGDALASSPPR